MNGTYFLPHDSRSQTAGNNRESLLREVSHCLLPAPTTYKFKSFPFHTSSKINFWPLESSYAIEVGTVLIPLRWGWASFVLCSHGAAPGLLSKDHHVPAALVSSRASSWWWLGDQQKRTPSPSWGFPAGAVSWSWVLGEAGCSPSSCLLLLAPPSSCNF